MNATTNGIFPNQIHPFHGANRVVVWEEANDFVYFLREEGYSVSKALRETGLSFLDLAVDLSHALRDKRPSVVGWITEELHSTCDRDYKSGLAWVEFIGWWMTVLRDS